jgi:hypothetical protein
MKRFIMLFVLLLSLILFSGTVTAIAGEDNTKADSALGATLNDGDYAMLQASIHDRSLGDAAATSVLYDYAGAPRYIVCDTSVGYLILDRLTGIVLEWATCPSPYLGYGGEKGFYGGYGLYFIQQQDGSYFDILQQEVVSDVAHMESIDDIDPEVVYGEGRGIPPVGEGRLTPLYIVSQNTIPNAYDYIQRLSFGNNGGSNGNTCTAVACQIVLNYLDKRVDNAIVPAQWEAERLSNDYWSQSSYPNTDAHHNYLIDYCNFAPIVGVYGQAVTTGVMLYSHNNPGVQSTGLSVQYDINPLGHWGRISADIDRGLPSMITTPPWAPDASYSAHSMAVAGYRVDSSGAREVQVHNGWYNGPNSSSNIVRANNAYSHVYTYISVSSVYCSYSFKFNAGWHIGGDGKWRLFDPYGNVISAPPIRDGSYVIRPAFSPSRVLDIDKASTQNLANAIIWPSTLMPNQIFTFTSDANGYFRIAPIHSSANNMVLDVEGGHATIGAKVIQWGRNAPGNDANQLWHVRDNGDGTFSFFSKLSLPTANNPGLAMDVSGSMDANGSNVIVWPYGGGLNQRFRLIPLDLWQLPAVPPSDNTVTTDRVKIKVGTSSSSSMFLDIFDNSMSIGAPVIIWPNTDGYNQRFYLERQPDGYHAIRSVSSGRILTANGVAEAAPVVQNAVSGSVAENQKWSIISNGDGSYKICNKLSGLSLDSESSSITQGARMVLRATPPASPPAALPPNRQRFMLIPA